ADLEHHRHRRPVDVRVEQADAEPQSRQRHRQVRRHGRFADSALAAADRDYVLGALQAHAPGFLAELGFNSMHPKLDAGHAEVMGKRMMDFRGELADYIVALGDLPNRDRVAAVLTRLGILYDSQRNDIGGVTGIVYVSERLDDRIVWYLSRH